MDVLLNSVTFWAIVNMLLSRGSAYLVRLYPLRRHMRVSPWAVLPFCAAECLIYLLLQSQFGGSVYEAQMYQLCFTVVSMTVPFLLTKGVFWQNVYLFSVLFCTGLAGHGVANWAAVQFEFLDAAPYMVNTLAIFVFALVFVPVGLQVLDKTLRECPDFEDPFWKIVWLVPMLFGFMLLANSVVINPSIHMGWLFLGSRLLILVATIIVCWVLARTMRQSAERRELAEQKRLSDSQARLRAELMETISHEARTPLAVLASYAGVVSMELRDKGVGEDLAADMDKIVSEAKRVAGLIDALKKLPLDKDGQRAMEPLDIGKVIAQTAELYRHIVEKAGLQLLLEIPPDLPRVLGNAEGLTQALFNILQNAKSNTSEGSVAIRAVAHSCHNSPGTGFIEVTVADTGRGIAPELLPHVLERGVSGLDGGTGIGLAVCKDIVEAHGGSIRVESSVGAGTSVVVALPAMREASDGE